MAFKVVIVVGVEVRVDRDLSGQIYNIGQYIIWFRLSVAKKECTHLIWRVKCLDVVVVVPPVGAWFAPPR